MSPLFGPDGEILFLFAEGHFNYLGRMNQDGSGRSKIVPYPISVRLIEKGEEDLFARTSAAGWSRIVDPDPWLLLYEFPSKLTSRSLEIASCPWLPNFACP